ncbi:MAG: carbohydrate ABC transporter permease [Chloroflexi bacterium]|nr:carbohydrate ABC transporter permease [Chloroflexota bacterium]MCI0578078.1 carbohydrate ABC transporter permease [Chloroflexota bacterium]MCI0646066.1 carbohydrate ABC transporter permease [Chloroflexota bacterium]MCI0730996.1 carbohydrate ABC transporter permease [Chloroflexota bacterium]
MSSTNATQAAPSRPKEFLSRFHVSTWQSQRLQQRVTHTLSHLILISGAVVMVLPFLWMLATSFKAPGKTFVYPPEWIPAPFIWENYPNMWTALPFGQFFINSIKIAGLTMIGQLVTCSMAAFAFSILKFRAREILFLLLIATLMIPYQVTLIPTFILFSKIGWVGTHLPLWVPAFWGGAFGTFLLRQFYLTIPLDLAESARIDGASIWQIFRHIYIPLSGPAMAALAIFTFMWSWNDLLNPLIYVTELDQLTLTIGLSFFQNQYGGKWTLMMAGAVVSILPILVIFFFAQKYFIQGIAMTGLKR